MIKRSTRRSQEVVRCPLVDVAELILLGSWVELQEGVLHKLVDLHDGCLVAASVAVVRRREHRDHVAVVRPVEPVHDELVGACNQFQIVRVVELFRDVLTEGVAGAPG